MDSQKVLLRRGPDDRYTEVGTVLAIRGRTLTLLLPDGKTVQHERGRDEVTPTAGSYAHLARIAPHVVVSTLEQQPAVVYKQLLLESKRGLTARDAKQKLSDMDRALVDRSWNIAKPLLAEDPDVIATEDHHPVYKLQVDSVGAFAALFPTGSLPPATELFQREGQPNSGSTGPTAEDPVAQTDEKVPAAGVLVEHPTTSVPASPPAATRSDDRPLLVQRLTRLVDGLDAVSSLADLRPHLLAVADRFSKLASKAQAELVEGLDGPERRLLALTAGPGKNDLLSDEVADLRAGDYAAALDAALAELHRHHGARPLKRALAALFARAQAAGGLATPRLVKLAGAFSDSPSETQELDTVLELVATHLRSEDAVPEVRSLDLTTLARAARSASFLRTGGRSSLVAALYGRDPKEARQRRWWNGAQIAQLAEAGHGPLATALEDEQVVRDLVVPLVEDYVSGISSRSALALLWSFPSSLARHVSGERLARILANLAGRDQVVAQWRDGLTNARQVAALETKIASLTTALGEARDEMESHAQRSRKLESDLLRTADQLAQARNSATSDRSAHDRQIRLDLMRTLASLAAQVMQSEAARSDKALTRVVSHLCMREGLAPLAQPGDRAPYDPAVHDPLGKALEPGAPTTVVRGGYTWTDGEKDVVLLKPQVLILQE